MIHEPHDPEDPVTYPPPPPPSGAPQPPYGASQPPYGAPMPPYGAAPVPPAAGPGQPPLAWPLYGASFGQAFTRYWKKYATFTGRASLSEFWWTRLALFLITLVLVVIMVGGGLAGATYDPITGDSEPGPLIGVGALLYVLFGLATIVPELAISWRRLHDANLAGPFYLLAFIPGVGGIIVLVLTLLPSNPAGRRFDR